MIRKLLFVLLGVGLISIFPVTGQWRTSVQAQKAASQNNPVNRMLPPDLLFKRVSPSVVVVEVLDLDKSLVGRGSGVVVAPNQVVTNKHVIDDGIFYRLRQGDKILDASLMYISPDHDLAKLKTEGLASPAVTLRPSARLSVGERVYAIGSPRGLELTLSEGLISGLRQYENGSVVQTSAALSPGSSGGGLFDGQGQLVGITTFSLTESQNLNFALSADWAQELINLPGHAPRRELPEEIKQAFSNASTVKFNLESMVLTRRLSKDSSYHHPRSKASSLFYVRSFADSCMVAADSPACCDNWPLWQRTDLDMLTLREDILRVGPSEDAFETGFINGARVFWSDLTDIYCRERPGGIYTDLEGKIRACPNAR